MGRRMPFPGSRPARHKVVWDGFRTGACTGAGEEQQRQAEQLEDLACLLVISLLRPSLFTAVGYFAPTVTGSLLTLAETTASVP